MTIDQLETPAVLVDLDVLEANIARLADYARRHDLRLRPHAKTHKSPAIARMQIQSGCRGITVAKPGEAVNDRNTMGAGACSLSDCAMRVLVTHVVWNDADTLTYPQVVHASICMTAFGITGTVWWKDSGRLKPTVA